MAGTIPDYKKLKSNADKSIGRNLKLYKNWIGLCKEGATMAEDAHDKLVLSSSSINTYVKKIDDVAKLWLPAAETLVDLQTEMKVAQKKKKTAEIAELKLKIKAAEKVYDKQAKHLLHLFDRMFQRYSESKSLADAVLKI